MCWIPWTWLPFSSVQFHRSVMSDSLWPHESQHARPPCPSPTPGVHSNSCPSSRWCHPAISSTVVPFSSCPQSLPASGSFPISQPLFKNIPLTFSFLTPYGQVKPTQSAQHSGEHINSAQKTLMNWWINYLICSLKFPGGSDGKESACNSGDPGLIPESGRSPEKEMVTQSSILAWKIPWTEEPGQLQSMHCKVRHDWATSLLLSCSLKSWLVFIQGRLEFNLRARRKLRNCPILSF